MVIKTARVHVSVSDSVASFPCSARTRPILCDKSAQSTHAHHHLCIAQTSKCRQVCHLHSHIKCSLFLLMITYFLFRDDVFALSVTGHNLKKLLTIFEEFFLRGETYD